MLELPNPNHLFTLGGLYVLPFKLWGVAPGLGFKLSWTLNPKS